MIDNGPDHGEQQHGAGCLVYQDPVSCGECNVISLYFMCCSVNGSVYLVCCVFNSVCELFGETIRNILLLNVMEVVVVVCPFQPCCCCLPTTMALASGGSPMFPLVVHQPASPSIWPAVQSLRRGLSTNPGATMWCVCGCS